MSLNKNASFLISMVLFSELSRFIVLRFAICSVVVELVEEKSCGGCGLDITKYSNTTNVKPELLVIFQFKRILICASM